MTRTPSHFSSRPHCSPAGASPPVAAIIGSAGQGMVISASYPVPPHRKGSRVHSGAKRTRLRRYEHDACWGATCWVGTGHAEYLEGRHLVRAGDDTGEAVLGDRAEGRPLPPGAPEGRGAHQVQA